MTGSLQSSALYGRLFPAGAAGRLFSDGAEVRAMLVVEGALAKAQGALGLIPETAARAIHRASLELTVDPAGLAAATGRNGVPVPALVAAFRDAMQAPDHAQYLHFGATSQDIQDSGLMLRLRQLLAGIEAELRELLGDLARLAERHADLPMAGRTYGQWATPVSFGAVVAHWGQPLLDALDELPALRDRALWVSLSGAAGTAAALGPRAAELRADLARGLGLADPGRSWHSDRGPVLRIAAWLTRVGLALGKLGEDAILMTQGGVAELRLGEAGASSTMPQKQNPVAPSALVALARHLAALNGGMMAAGAPRQERDGAAWFTEWLSLPQLCLSAASSVEIGRRLATGMAPDPDAMAATLAQTRGLMQAEALSFRLAGQMPRPEAQAAVKTLCQRAVDEGRDLGALAAAEWPDADIADLFDVARQLGAAPDEARSFASAVRVSRAR